MISSFFLSLGLFALRTGISYVRIAEELSKHVSSNIIALVYYTRCERNAWYVRGGSSVINRGKNKLRGRLLPLRSEPSAVCSVQQLCTVAGGGCLLPPPPLFLPHTEICRGWLAPSWRPLLPRLVSSRVFSPLKYDTAVRWTARSASINSLIPPAVRHTLPARCSRGVIR